MPDTTPAEHSKTEAPVSPAAPAAVSEIGQKKPEAVKEVPQPGKNAEIIDTGPGALQNNEKNVLNQGGKSCNAAVAKLEVLKNLTVG